MKGGVDKGFCLSYWRLSYRRKFLRTLWMIPWALAALVVMLITDPFGIIVSWIYAGFLAASLLAQGIYNYRKWQREQQPMETTNKPVQSDDLRSPLTG